MVARPGLYDVGYAAPAIAHTAYAPTYSAPAIAHTYAAPAFAQTYAAPAVAHTYAAPIVKAVAAPVSILIEITFDLVLISK